MKTKQSAKYNLPSTSRRLPQAVFTPFTAAFAMTGSKKTRILAIDSRLPVPKLRPTTETWAGNLILQRVV
ncbi:hypothetical protein ACKGJO_14650 [Gracilimonas sp. Q87]|uniref:hypothetical protein n=1 Tax=Gracilimonas sp. Q87 TaxID=3384766 RepID=UPI003984294C